MAETLQLVWDSLWSANPIPGRLIVLVIVAVVAKAAFETRRQLNRYWREDREIRRVSQSLGEWRADGAASVDADEEETDTQADEKATEASSEASGNERNPPEARTEKEPGNATVMALPHHPGLIDLDHLINSVDPSSLIGDRIRAIAKMRLYRVKVDLDTLQELALYRDAAAPGHGFPGFAAGLSMMLGILGTFIGLAAMVQEIHLGLPTDTTNLTPDSWMSSVHQLGMVLGGMKTAFSTSLVGMTGAIGASAAAFQIGHRRHKVFEALERLTAAELIPATVPAVEDEVLLAQVSRQLDDSFSRLDEIYRQNQEALKDLTAAQQACVAIVDEVRDITRGQAARNLDQILGQLAQSNEAVLAVSRQIPRIVSTFDTTARGIRESAERLMWSPSAARTEAGKVLGLRPSTWLAILIGLAATLSLTKMLGAF